MCFHPSKVFFCLDIKHIKLYFTHMDRSVRRELIDEWIRSQPRDGVGELAKKSNVPTGSISKIRNGRVPKNVLIRRALAKALGVTESELFPILADGKVRAS